MNILRKGFIYGGDYNPEQWLDRPDILEQDIVLMKKARINTVTLGVFSWSVLEPEEDHYHFQWLIDTINRINQPLKMIMVFLWLQYGPGKYSQSYRIDPGFFHKYNILF